MRHKLTYHIIFSKVDEAKEIRRRLSGHHAATSYFLVHLFIDKEFVFRYKSMIFILLNR